MNASTHLARCVRQAVPILFALAASACAVAELDEGTPAMTQQEIATAGSAVVCGSSTDQVHCHGKVIVDSFGHAACGTAPAGFGPRSLRSAYKISGTGSSATTIALVEAYGYANAEHDLGVYRAQFGLPSCTTGNGCFRKVTQDGAPSGYPADNVGWAEETALDLDMASAICPSCKLLLVQAYSAQFDDIAAAVNRAAAMGAHVINNSFGGDEYYGSTYEAAWNHAGVAITVSAGDVGYGQGVQFPSSSPHVTAVGGTTLATASNTRGWTETAWSGSVSGCSGVFAKPSWQTDTACTGRTVNDVSAVADPNTGVAVYGPASDTTTGWIVLGGTSAAAPIIAGVYGVNGGAVHYGADPYSHLSSLFDVRTGPANFCDPANICQAVVGYDGPTGLGTPNGTGAF